ncbi:sulfatase [Blastopirellula retiformator]|uniref:Arylsulfatase n=1 Tax=Blastopirellula retiformator TaxID=2527970 RepID=A0A5C5V6I3_9BACT|nr:sulfatase [Blastopirellula retiformator]TWT34126.1 Arylsulfatase [Blastopirellula retiformator]
MRYSLLISILALLLFTANLSAADPPNIVLIMTDDMGWNDLHCQGNARLRSPQIDRLATQGVRFTSAYAAAPVCSPTRGALITGLAPARLQITQHGADVPQFWPQDRKVQPPTTEHELAHATTTLAERLSKAGYATGFFGKWHLGDDPKYWPTEHGFDVNLGGCGYGGPPTYFDPYRIPTLPSRKPGEYLTDRLADEAIAWLERKQDQPVFLCLWTYNPHYPFEAPADLIPPYEGQEGPGLKNPIYAAQIEATDRAVGRVLQALDRLEMTDDTLVIFTSDNGGWLGATDNRPLREGKGFLYEGGLRVPLIIRWPGVATPGEENATPVISMDLTATILAAAGVKLGPAESLDGETLRPLLRGKPLARDALYFHYPHFAFHHSNRPGSAIRRGDYKLILNYDDDSIELYHLAKDESEKKNLAAVQPEVAQQLKSQLQAWLTETKAGLPTKRE